MKKIYNKIIIGIIIFILATIITTKVMADNEYTYKIDSDGKNYTAVTVNEQKWTAEEYYNLVQVDFIENGMQTENMTNEELYAIYLLKIDQSKIMSMIVNNTGNLFWDTNTIETIQNIVENELGNRKNQGDTPPTSNDEKTKKLQELKTKIDEGYGKLYGRDTTLEQKQELEKIIQEYLILYQSLTGIDDPIIRQKLSEVQSEINNAGGEADYDSNATETTDIEENDKTISGTIIVGNAGGNGGSNDKVDPDSYTPGEIESPEKVTKIASIIINTIKILGVVVAVISLILIGYKYMTGSLTEKAEYKKTMIPYIVGIVLIANLGWMIQLIAEMVAGIQIN